MSADLALFSPGHLERDPDDIARWLARVWEMRRKVLVEGTDWMQIPRTPKPTLLQPGAEKLLLLSGLGFEIERSETIEGQGVYYIATVPGRSQCEGYAGRDEFNFKTAPWNTIVKMAQKRAKIGAISSALALSGLFTVDIEDYPSEVVGGGAHGAPGDPATSPSARAHETGTVAHVSSAEAKHALIEAFEGLGWAPLRAREKAAGLWGNRGRRPIARDELEELIGRALESEGPEDAALPLAEP